jgi:hypothetical protein
VAITALEIIVNNVIGLSWVQFRGEPFEYGRRLCGDLDSSAIAQKVRRMVQVWNLMKVHFSSPVRITESYISFWLGI